MEKQIIGINCLVSIGSHKKIPAKIDTGADSSSIWVSNVHFDEQEGMLSFSLFGKDSPYYNGEILKTQNYKVAKIKSSMGHVQYRFKVQLPIKIEGRKINAWFNMSNRINNKFPILIGRYTLRGKFLVDPSINLFKKLTKTKKVGLKDNLTKEEINQIVQKSNAKSIE